MRATTVFLPLFLLTTGGLRAQSSVTVNQPDSGYRGIWYAIGPVATEYRYKYSGGLGTYPANHNPFAVYVPSVQKTFFCYGGTNQSSNQRLLHLVSYYDHHTGTVPRPTIVLDKQTDDAHDNPVMNVDSAGYIWLFSTSHGTERPSYVHRSRQPHDVGSFEQIQPTRQQGDSTVLFDNFSYLQSYYQTGRGFFHLMTHYERGVLRYGANKPRRTIGYITSPDGVRWSALRDIAAVEEGHYQTSGQWKDKIGTSFNVHPDTQKGSGLDYRTNLYYVETADFGRTWHTADGQSISLPLTNSTNAALVHDYRSLGRNVYINDVAFDKQGRPALLYVTSRGPEPGPAAGPYEWHVAYWTGRRWRITPVTTSDHNYDMGSLYCETGRRWRIIGPTQPGPQAYNTGGEMAVWRSRNRGRTWRLTDQLTRNSLANHSYARKPSAAHPDFYAFWADGHGRQPSPSALYFSTKRGRVYRLPRSMDQPTARPELVKPGR